jgi:hypothetical protein
MLHIVPSDALNLYLRLGSGMMIRKQRLMNPMAGNIGVQSAVLVDTSKERMGSGG